VLFALLKTEILGEMMQAIPPEDMTVAVLRKGINLDRFNCGDDDLNSFLKSDAFIYEEKKIAKTYIVLYQNEPIGFFSICADAIRLSREERFDEFGVEKPHADYPAIKIARLAVSKSHSDKGVGTYMVKQAVGKTIGLSEQVGCRFVTVDAYPAAIRFYEGCGFVRNLAEKSGTNASMRLDLIDALRH